MRIIFFCFLLLAGHTSYATEIAGVTIPETLTTSDAIQLHLNGAGIRSKFFFDIYIAELYMAHPAASAAAVIAAPGNKRMIMHFLYDEVTGDKLVAGWNDGFAGNLTADKLATLQKRINRFNTLFRTVKKDDVILLDYLPGHGTVVTISGQEMGVIEGKDFNDALLNIWLGPNPVNRGLKEKLLTPQQ